MVPHQQLIVYTLQDRDNLGMRIQLMDKDGHAVMLDGKPVLCDSQNK